MGTAITMTADGLSVPDDPIIPFIEGDGIGPDIWAASVRVFDAAVEKAYGGAKKIAWKAQTRLCGRYRTLTRAGKNTKLVCVAIARELAGFIWDIVRQEMPRLALPEG